MQNHLDSVANPFASKNRILYTRKALKNLNNLNLSCSLCDRISKRIQQLETTPYPVNCKKLKAFKNRWEIPCGAYRIWYEPHCAAGKIEIIWIGHHQDDFHKSNFMKRVA